METEKAPLRWLRRRSARRGAESSGANRSMPPARTLPFLRLLHNRNFVSLVVGRNLSNWGDAIYGIALVWFMYRSTGSVLATAGVSAVIRSATVVAGPLGGVYVDRWDRRRTMMAVDTVRMGLLLVLAALAWHRDLHPWAVYAIVFLLACLSTMFGPAFVAVMAAILPREELAAGNGLYRSIGQANGLLAQAVGGAVVALAGPVGSFLLDAASCAFSIGGVWWVHLPPLPRRQDARVRERRQTFWHELGDGWRTVTRDARFRSLMLILFVATAGGGATGALVPVIVFRQLHGGPALLGAIEAVTLLGGIAGGLSADWISRRLSLAGLLALDAALLGAGFVGFGLSHTVGLSMGMCLVIGGAETATGSAFQAFFQATVPPQLMGRTFGFVGAAEGATGPVSALAGGWLGAVFGPAPVIIGAGLWFVGTGALALSIRTLRMTGISGAEG